MAVPTRNPLISVPHPHASLSAANPHMIAPNPPFIPHAGAWDNIPRDPHLPRTQLGNSFGNPVSD